MPKSRIPSPARSQSALVTPRCARPRGPRSVGSPARSNTSVRLTSVIQNFKDKNMDSFHLSPLNSRRSVLNDNTDIEEPKRNSWWKKLNDTSRDIMEVLASDKQEEPYNVIEEYMDVEVLSQEKKNPTLDLPDSSDNESISSIVIPQRKLFNQKENQPQPQKKFAQLLGPRESMAKLNKTSGASDKSEKTIVTGPKKLFGQGSKPRSKPAFPTELLKFSPDKTTNKTAGEIKGQVRNLFGNRAGVKRKNNFADFIASESEEELEIQPKVFGFQKKSDVPSRRVSTASRGNRNHSPTSSVTTDIDIENYHMEDWKVLPSSTMVQTQLEAMITDSPAKKAKLSKLSEGKESEAATNSTAISNKTKQSNKSFTSKNKSKTTMSKTSLNKSKSSPKRNNEIVNEEAPEQVELEIENDDIEVSLHYSDDDPQEDNLEQQNKNDGTNKSKQSNTSSISKYKSKISNSVSKSKISNNAQTSIVKEANIAVENENNEILNESTKNDSREELAEGQEEISGVKNTNGEIEDENAESEVEHDEEPDSESQEMEDDKQNSEVEQENESQEMNEGNQDSEVDEEDEQANESQEIEHEKQYFEVEQENEIAEMEGQEHAYKDIVNENQVVDTDLPADKYKQNERLENVVGNLDEVKIMEIDNEVALDETANKNMNISKKYLLVNESKISKTNVSQNLKKALSADEIEQVIPEEVKDSEGNNIISRDDGEAHEMDNFEENIGNDKSHKSKQTNDSVAFKNKSRKSLSKKSMSKITASPNKSITKIHESALKSVSNKNEIVNENIADEDQIDAEDAVASESRIIDEERDSDKKIDNESVDNESEQERKQGDSPEVENESQELENQSSEVEEEEQEIGDNDDGNVIQEVVNESGGENEEDEENDDEEQNESEEVEVENQSQEEEEQSQEIEEDSQEVDNDEAEDEEAEESEIEQDIESEGEIDEDIDNQQESNEVMEESDGQNDTENDNPSQEEISGTDDGTPNSTHDTTGRNRKKNATNVPSPEAIAKPRDTNENETYIAKGRNTSIRGTSLLKSLNLKPSLAPPRDSTGLSDGTRNSSAEGSGWDSHRITKKTLRQTFGRDFTPRKSLRALVMEKSAKRHTEFYANDFDVPRANSTELPEDTRHEMEVDSHDVSKRTRQTTLEMYLQKIKKQNIEKRKKMEEEVRNCLKAPTKELTNTFTAPSRPFALKRGKPLQNKPKTKAVKTMIPLDDLPQELIEDMKYKPPRRFQPSNASWITKRLYKFLEGKLEAKYDYKARIRAEKLVETIYNFTKDLRRHNVAPSAAVDALKLEMARLDVVKTHFDFYQFFHDYMPREVRVKLRYKIIYNCTKDLRRHNVAPSAAVDSLKLEMARLDVKRTHQFFHVHMTSEVRVKVNPDVVNKIPLPRQGVFADILRGNTVQG